jgi:hypothetical protein
MIIPKSNYWNLALGGKPGDVLNDEEGMQILRTLRKNMTWLMKKLE